MKENDAITIRQVENGFIVVAQPEHQMPVGPEHVFQTIILYHQKI